MNLSSININDRYNIAQGHPALISSNVQYVPKCLRGLHFTIERISTLSCFSSNNHKELNRMTMTSLKRKLTCLNQVQKQS